MSASNGSPSGGGWDGVVGWRPPLARREFLKLATVASGAAAFAPHAIAARADQNTRTRIVDVNVHLSRWPMRRVPCDETPKLVSKLRARGVAQAWAGSFDALLHKDLAGVNERLTAECARHGKGLLLPFGSINPTVPGWEEELRRCAREHRMRGIRLYPNYHGYRLDGPGFGRALARGAEEGLIVQVALVMEDERMMHPLLRVEPVEVRPLWARGSQVPGLKLVLVNALRTVRGEALKALAGSGNVWVEISMLEGVGAVRALLDLIPSERVLFGSYAPLFYFEAAELKLREAELTTDELQQIRSRNAERLLRKS